jgi:tetratricopeptide (TPR) repeat protein
MSVSKRMLGGGRMRIWTAVVLSFVCRDLSAVVSTREEWTELVERSAALCRAGKTAEAEAGYREALSEAHALDVDAGRIALVWRGLGMVDWELGRFAESENAHKNALVELERIGVNDSRVVLASADLLTFYVQTGQLGKAERFETGCRNAPWRDRSSTEVAWFLNAVAMLRCRQGRFDQAEDILTRALEMEQRGVPDPILHVRLAANLGGVYFRTSRFDEAVRLLRRTVDVERMRSGPRSPMLVIPLSNLATLYKATGRYEEAAEALQQALAIVADDAYGRNHPIRGEILSSYAQVLKALHRNKESKAASKQASEIAREAGLHGGTSLVDIADLKH